MWKFLTDTKIYDPSIYRLATILAVFAVAGIPILIYAKKTARRLLKGLWLLGTFIVVIVLLFSLSVDYYYWVDGWEGRITAAYSSNGWSFRSGKQITSYFLKIKLDDIGPEIEVTVSPATYSQINIGNYITKQKGTYWPQIQG